MQQARREIDNLQRRPEQALMRTHLTLAQIRIAAALRNIQDAERSLALSKRPPAVDAPLDAAA